MALAKAWPDHCAASPWHAWVERASARPGVDGAQDAEAQQQDQDDSRHRSRKPAPGWRKQAPRSPRAQKLAWCSGVRPTQGRHPWKPVHDRPRRRTSPRRPRPVQQRRPGRLFGPLPAAGGVRRRPAGDPAGVLRHPCRTGAGRGRRRLHGRAADRHRLRPFHRLGHGPDQDEMGPLPAVDGDLDADPDAVGPDDVRDGRARRGPRLSVRLAAGSLPRLLDRDPGPAGLGLGAGARNTTSAAASTAGGRCSTSSA